MNIWQASEKQTWLPWSGLADKAYLEVVLEQTPTLQHFTQIAVEWNNLIWNNHHEYIMRFEPSWERRNFRFSSLTWSADLLRFSQLSALMPDGNKVHIDDSGGFADNVCTLRLNPKQLSHWRLAVVFICSAATTEWVLQQRVCSRLEDEMGKLIDQRFSWFWLLTRTRKVFPEIATFNYYWLPKMSMYHFAVWAVCLHFFFKYIFVSQSLSLQFSSSVHR